MTAIALPLRIRALDESFVIDDASGRLILAVYFCPGTANLRAVRKRISRADAEAAAKAAARGIPAMVEASPSARRSARKPPPSVP